MATCSLPECTTELTGRQTHYCGPRCARRAYSRQRVADGRHAAYYANNPEAQRKRAAAARAWTKAARQAGIEHTCIVCSGTFTAAHEEAAYCPREECQAWRWIVGRQTAVPSTHPNLLTRVPLCHAFYRRTCAHAPCGREFRTVWGNTDYCSTKCRERAAAVRKRPKRRGRHQMRKRITRANVFERDEWMCQLCGEEIERGLVWPAGGERAGVLDHIVPHGHGGERKPWNLRAAHELCNRERGDRLDLVDVALYLELAALYPRPSRYDSTPKYGLVVRA